MELHFFAPQKRVRTPSHGGINVPSGLNTFSVPKFKQSSLKINVRIATRVWRKCRWIYWHRCGLFNNASSV